MRTGDLDQRIVLQSVTSTNNVGSVTESYATVATVWGHVMSQRGQEALESARLNARETIRVKIRYRTDVDVKWRIQWGGQNYNIKAVDRSNRRDGELWLTAELVGAV